MRRIGLTLAISLLAVASFAHPHPHSRNVSIHTDGSERFGDCSSRNVSFDGERAAVQREEISAAGLGSLRVKSGRGGVSVRGGNAWSIVACKAAPSDAALRNINVRLSGNELSHDGDTDGDWYVFYYVTAPRNAELSVEATNGPVALRDVEGQLTVRASNGPLSLSNVSGRVDVETTNGPISINGGSGNVKVAAKNGPLSVTLAGASWNGELEASTKNGPLSVRVPRNYRSAVLVESLGHGPVSCKAEGCAAIRARNESRNDDDHWGHRDRMPRSFELGSGPRNVRLSTVNGPLTVKDSD